MLPDKIFDNLNPEQLEAVNHFTGPCVVVAVPGSGKTMTLTARIVHLVRNKGIDPRNLLCLTFTNKAAGEMRDRSSKVLGQQSSEIWFSTFHALCLAILRKHGKYVGLTDSFSVYAERDQRDLVEKIARMHELDASPGEVGEIARAINDFREEIDDFEHAVQEFGPTQKAIMREYLQTLDEFNAVDFSGILYKVWELFRVKPAAAEQLHEKFKFLMIDETQDTNTIQYEIVRRIADPKLTRKGNLFAVGDFNQSIFAWRGAKPENINRLFQDFDDVKRITLPRNYRSTPQVLEIAQRLIRNNSNARDVELISTKPNGPNVIVQQHPQPEEESRRLVSAIVDLHRQGYRYQDIAVLYRTNELSKVPEMWLRRYQIPYRIVGGFSFFDRAEIKLALGYLAFFSNPQDTVSFARIIESPRRGIGKTLVGRMERICQQEKATMLDVCRNLKGVKGATVISQTAASKFAATVDKWKQAEAAGTPLATVVAGLLQDMKYVEYVEKDMPKDPDEASRRMNNVEELLSGIADFQQQKPGAKIVDYLHTVQLMTSIDRAKEEDAVSLLTMHSAKGLEFPVVYIIGCEENLIPHSMAVQERGYDEERRLMYVAVTRAKERLVINHCRARHRFDRKRLQQIMFGCRPSPFLAEMFPDDFDA